jgi:acetyl esterase/lipase
MNPVDDLIVPAIVKAVSEVTGFRRVATVDRIVARQAGTAAVVPSRTARRVQVEDTSIEGMRVVELSPVGVPPAAGSVVYLHGGAYVLETSRPQWSLATFLAQRVPTKVHVLLYPLAPTSTAATTVPAVAAVLDAVDGPITVVGDSAGGGLAVAAVQHLAATGRRVPSRLVLVSPWLDAALTNPGIAPLEGRDPLFTCDALRYAGRLYAGDLAVDHPFVSPIQGPVSELPPITIFAGTRDILWPDINDFAIATNASLHRRDGALHDHLLMPGPVARRDRDLLRALLQSEEPHPDNRQR